MTFRFWICDLFYISRLKWPKWFEIISNKTEINVCHFNIMARFAWDMRKVCKICGGDHG
jgi:hypothetical protein